MNDSPYGLTASMWTNVDNADSHEVFLKFVSELDTGTVTSLPESVCFVL